MSSIGLVGGFSGLGRAPHTERRALNPSLGIFQFNRIELENKTLSLIGTGQIGQRVIHLHDGQAQAVLGGSHRAN